MHSMAKFILPTAFAALAAAATNGTTVSLFIPAADAQPLVASAIGASEAVTTFLVACPTGTGSSNCGYPEPFTLVEGPSTVSYAYSDPADKFTQTINCGITASSTAVCTATQEGGNKPGTQTYTIPNATYMPVSLVAADWAFAAAVGTGGAKNGTAPTAAAPTATASNSGAIAGVSGTAKASGTATGNGAAPRITAMAGALAAAAMAMAAL